MITAAKFSTDRRYRYWLSREWDTSLPRIAFIGLNPSTADEQADDPTIRRVIGFAKGWGYGAILMLNLYSFRATDPRDLWRAHRAARDIVGGVPGFLLSLQEYAEKFGAKQTIAAWGRDHCERWRTFYGSDWKLDCLQKNRDGSPTHPLYLSKFLTPNPWNYSQASL